MGRLSFKLHVSTMTLLSSAKRPSMLLAFTILVMLAGACNAQQVWMAARLERPQAASHPAEPPTALAMVDIQQMFAAWESDVRTAASSPQLPTAAQSLPPAQPPAQLQWWAEGAGMPLRDAAGAIPIDLPTLFSLTAMHSARVQAVAQTAWISGTQIEQARGAFDPRLYSDNDFSRTSDPVESTLATGGPPRLEDELWGSESGLRGQTSSGASYGVGQRLGHKNSNSTFFVPDDQGSAGLFANWNQPLLQGRWIDPNRSLVLTARFETAAAQAKYADAIQTQLSDVAAAYWSLYSERAMLLMRQRHLARAQQIAEQLEQRQSFDSIRSQVLRAKAAVANRKAELALSEANIKNWESRLRSLVNAPSFSDQRRHELVPVQPVLLAQVDFEIDSEVAIAIQRRPEIQELHEKMNATQVRLDLARDRTRPQLNLLLEGKLAGRRGDSDIGGAWTDQFTRGRPGLGGGLEYELPYRNRTAKAQVRQRQLERIQLNYLIEEMSGNVRAEVETAIRNLRASYEAALSRQESLAAEAAEIEHLEDRWRMLGNDPGIATLQLDDILSAHDRLLREEQGLLQAVIQYNRSLIEVQRATGALVQFSNGVDPLHQAP